MNLRSIPGALPPDAGSRVSAAGSPPAEPRSRPDSVLLSGPSADATPIPDESPLWKGYPSGADLPQLMGWFRPMTGGLPGHPTIGYAARLALALGGEVDFPGAPEDSMLERSFADSHPDRTLAPAFEAAARAGIPTSCESLVDLAETMVNALAMDYNRPMEKAYAAIRIQVGLAECLGKAKPVADGGIQDGEGFLLAELRNLKRDAQSVALAQVTVQAVQEEFGRMREIARKFDQDGGLSAASHRAESPPSEIEVNKEEHFVNIGGVKVAIRR